MMATTILPLFSLVLAVVVVVVVADESNLNDVSKGFYKRVRKPEWQGVLKKV